ncbi:MAG: arginase [Pikeienuella sp.]
MDTSAKTIELIGMPVDDGGSRRGCLMGPDMLRTAGLADALRVLGHEVKDLGDLKPDVKPLPVHPNTAIHHLEECAAWIDVIEPAAYGSAALPIFMGGDHLMSAGTVPGVARRSEELGQPQFVLWLDAHSDFHDLASTDSGNLHGAPAAYYAGRPGFEGYFPPLKTGVDTANILMLGLRSVDRSERERLAALDIEVADMRVIDEGGIAAPVRGFLKRVAAANGRLHVSLDVDFLEPSIAPAVGTTVPGGATFREAHLVMELLHDSDLVTSLDIAELNPYLDHQGKTADLMVDLVASLFGKSVVDRPTRTISV